MYKVLFVVSDSTVVINRSQTFRKGKTSTDLVRDLFDTELIFENITIFNFLIL